MTDKPIGLRHIDLLTWRDKILQCDVSIRYAGGSARTHMADVVMLPWQRLNISLSTKNCRHMRSDIIANEKENKNENCLYNENRGACWCMLLNFMRIFFFFSFAIP